MNRDLRFERPRLRASAEILAQEGLTPERLGRLAERMARQEAVVSDCTRAARDMLRPAQGESWNGGALLALPDEIALRLLAGEISALTGNDPGANDHPIRLQRLETLWRDLRIALIEQMPLRRTLAGTLISVTPDGALTIVREPPRRNASRKLGDPAT